MYMYDNNCKTLTSERGASVCLKRPACTEKDYYELQAPCEQKKVIIDYKV